MPARPIVPSAVRVSGTLSADARLVPSTGAEPRAWLFLHFSPAAGLPYRARADLGRDAADHMLAEGLLPQLRTGAAVSVAGTGLQLRTDHGAAVLTVLDAHAVLLLGLSQPTATATATATTLATEGQPC